MCIRDSNWPGHMLHNAQTNTPSPYALLLFGEQRIGKDVFLRELLPPELRNYYTTASLANPRDMAATCRNKLLVVLSEGGFTGGNMVSTNMIKVLITNMPSSRRLYSSISEPAPDKHFLVFTLNETEFALLDRAQLATRILPIKMDPAPEARGSKMVEYTADIRDRFWAAAQYSQADAALPPYIMDMCYERFPADPDTLAERVVEYQQDLPVGTRYKIRTLIQEMDPSIVRIPHRDTAAVRAALARVGWVTDPAGTMVKEECEQHGAEG